MANKSLTTSMGRSTTFPSSRIRAHPLRWVVLVFVVVRHFQDDGGQPRSSLLGAADAAATTTVTLRNFRAVDILNSLNNPVSTNALDHNKKYSASNGSDVDELYLEQRLDHFRTSDPRTFLQRYFYSSRHVQKQGNATSKDAAALPVLALLCVGGEGPSLDKSVLVNSHHCTGDMLEFAKLHSHEYSIRLFALEHRYYGASYPDFDLYSNDDDDDGIDDDGPSGRADSVSSSFSSNSPVSDKNLVYLSSRQAIADIGHFITNQRHVKPSSASSAAPSVTWIAFGGSYPGMLAAWSRLKLPHLISMAVSSSAPVQQVVDMAVYKAHEAKVLANPIVGGSDECLRIVQQGHEDLVDAVQDRHRHDDIAQLFQLCDVKQLQKRKNVEMWLGDGVINLHVQENDPACKAPACGVQQICQELLAETQNNNSTDMEALAAVSALQVDACVDISWDDTVKFIADPIRGKKGGLRSWLWQTCTEVGYYQTCEANSTCPYAQGYHLLDQDLEICRKAFGIRNPQNQVPASVQETIDTYGGWKLQATKVLSVNGEIDPWSELALQKSSNTVDRPVYHVPGASHHFWTNLVRPSDSQEVQEAREIIFDTLLGWLKTNMHLPSDAVTAQER